MNSETPTNRSGIHKGRIRIHHRDVTYETPPKLDSTGKRIYFKCPNPGCEIAKTGAPAYYNSEAQAQKCCKPYMDGERKKKQSKIVKV